MISIDWKQKDEEINLKLLTGFFTWCHCIRSLNKNEMRFILVLLSNPSDVWPTVVEYVLCARLSVWHMVWIILTWSSSWNNLCSYFLFFILELRILKFVKNSMTCLKINRTFVVFMISYFFIFKDILGHNSHTIKFTLLEYTIQWFLMYSQSYATITPIS